MAQPFYPRIIPDLNDEQLGYLVQAIKDYQLTHGSLLKLVATEDGSSVLARPVGVSIFPTQFPRSCFDVAVELQKTYNELYMKVAADEEWLEAALGNLIHDDPFTRTLWGIHLDVKNGGYAQLASVGVFRNDYMVHLENEGAPPQPKQVEFNTYTVAGGTHGNIVADMHRHLRRAQLYGSGWTEHAEESTAHSFPPRNNTVESIVDALASAHAHYGQPVSGPSVKLAVLMVVQAPNFNICDERPIEFGLWDKGVPCFRVAFGDEFLQHTRLSEEKALLFSHPSHGGLTFEVSVAYMRAGYEPREFQLDIGRQCRLNIEDSRAIKCPSLLSHLTTYKKVQQQLSLPGVLERFLSPEKAAGVRSTFMPMYPMDGSQAGLEARLIAADAEKSSRYVLKPSLEGGGHNTYGEDIPMAIHARREEEWQHYILMKMIDTPPQDGVLLSPLGAYRGPVVSELGVFGMCLWERKRSQPGIDILENKQGGWSFKTKSAEVSEMSVVKGYGCFDSPCLVDLTTN